MRSIIGQRNSRHRRATCQPTSDSIATDLSALSGLSSDKLRTAWISRFGGGSPAVRSRDLLLGLLAWRIQAEGQGGLDAATVQKLREIANAIERDGSYEPKIRHEFSSGVVLTREWKGVLHRVTVTADGFQHLGKRYKSLSDVARTITGTRWSGPRFFGLEQKSAPLRQAAT